MPGASSNSRHSVLCTYPDVLHDALVANCRHFVKEELPRIRYSNPTLAIEVDKFPKTEADTWQSSLVMEFGEPLLLHFSLPMEYSTGFSQMMGQRNLLQWTRNGPRPYSQVSWTPPEHLRGTGGKRNERPLAFPSSMAHQKRTSHRYRRRRKGRCPEQLLSSHDARAVSDSGNSTKSHILLVHPSDPLLYS